MADWTSTGKTITTAGLALLEKVIAGETTLNITTAKVGNGRTSTLSTLASQTDVLVATGSSAKIATISNFTYTSTGVLIELQISNSGNTSPYTMEQIGVFATYNGSSVLLCVAQATEDNNVSTADILPISSASPVLYVYQFKLDLTNITQSSVTVDVSSAGMVTNERFTALNDSITPILDTFNNDVYLASATSNYTTTQTAVDAATVEYTSTGNYQTVINNSTISNIYTQAVGTNVCSIHEPSGLTGGRKRTPEPSYAPVNLPYCGGLIAIRSDDGNSSWLTTDTTFGGVSASTYLRNCGIPVSHAVPTSMIGTTGKFTWANLRDLISNYGCEIMSHSKTHTDTSPSNYNDAVNEILGSRDILENYTDSTWGIADNSLGAHIAGFMQPATWTDDYYINTKVKSDNGIAGQLIRSYYEYAGAYIGFSGQAGNCQRRYYSNSVDVELLPDTLAATITYLLPYAKLGLRIVFTVHNPLKNTTVATKLKNLADAIVAIRDDKTTYPNIYLNPVTLRSFHLGTTLPLGVNANTNLMKIDFSEYANNTDLSTITYNGNIPYRFVKGSNGGTITAKTTDGVSYVELYNTASSNPYIQISITLEEGRAYDLSYEVKSDTGKASAGHSVSCWYPPSSTVSTFPWEFVTSPQAYTTVHRTFGVPTWSNGLVVIMLRNYSSDTTVSIKNIKVNPM